MDEKDTNIKPNIKLPTQEECLSYFEKYKVPQNIKEHCLKVQEVAVFLAKELNKVGFNLNVELVSKTAVLHDLFKVVALDDLSPNKHHSYEHSEEEIAMWKHLRTKYPGMHETDVLYLIFKDDYPDFALNLKNHGNPFVENKLIEENLVHYCDWCVFKDKIVILSSRIDYCKEVYPQDEKFWSKDIIHMKEFEDKVLSKLSFKPEELKTEFEKS
tara:strand:- start:180 stop:821 length:642 start_codon:yes stop_codon:yes gene_type:complete